MPTRVARSGLFVVAVVQLVDRMRRRSAPTTHVPSCRLRLNTGSSQRTRRRSRWPMPPGFRCSTIRRCRRSSATPSPTTSTCASRWRASKRRAPVPASPSRTSIPRSTASPAYGVRQGVDDGRKRRHDASERRLRVPAVVGDRSVRSTPARAGSGAGAGAGERAGPARRAGDARRRRRLELFPAARARPAARDRPADAPPERRDRRLFSEPPGRRRVESSRARSHPGQSRADGRRDPRNRTPDRDQWRMRSRCCWAGRRDRSRATR